MSLKPFCKAGLYAALGISLACGVLLAACSAFGARQDKPAGEPVAYAVKVGYKDVQKGEKVIASKDDWDAFAQSLASVSYDGEGNEVFAPCEGLRDYDDTFFDKGNTLLVAYDDLGSGSYDPKIEDVELDGETLTVSYDMGVPGDGLVSTDMSGFVTVVEVPKGMTISTWNR